MLVLEKEQNTLVIVDPVSLTIVARVPVGHDPHEVAVSDDGRMAYISNYNGGNTIARVDLVAQKALTPIDLGAFTSPRGLEFVGGEAVLYGGGGEGGGAVRLGDGEDRLGGRDGAGPDAYGDCDEGLEDGDDVECEFGDDQLYCTGAARQGPPPGPPPGGGRPGGPPQGPPRGFGAPDWEVTNVPVGHGSEGST